MKKQNSGQGMLLGMVLASVITAIVVASGVRWYLSVQKTVANTEDQLREMSIAYDRGNKLENTGYNDIKEKAGQTEYFSDSTGKYTGEIQYGTEGIFKDGKCNTEVSSHDLKLSQQRCIQAHIVMKDNKGNTLQDMTYTRHSSQMSSAPIGTITTYDGDIANLPEGWRVCDGTGGTPDMTDKFIQGTTNQSEIGNISGNNWYHLLPENLPAQTDDDPNTKILIRSKQARIFDEGHGKRYSFTPDVPSTNPLRVPLCDVNNNGYIYFHKVSATVKTENWEGKPLETQPPYRKIFYIMRVK